MEEHYLVDINNRYGHEAACRSEDILCDIGFLLPKSYEYLSGKESVHIPLNRYGLVIRVGDRVNGINSDYFLNPLLEIPISSNASFEILPSIIVGCKYAPLTKVFLACSLSKEGLSWPIEERVTSNMGIIRNSNKSKDKLHNLVLDRGAVKHAKLGLKSIFGHSAKGAPIQDNTFGPLKHLAIEAYNFDNRSVRQDNFTHFLKTCRENVLLEDNDPDKVLYAEWKQKDKEREKSKIMYNAANAYDNKLSSAGYSNLTPPLKHTAI